MDHITTHSQFCRMTDACEKLQDKYLKATERGDNHRASYYKRTWEVYTIRRLDYLGL